MSLKSKRLRSPLWLLCAALIVVAAFMPSCSRGPRPNILLITVDTLRPDHLGYGGGRSGMSPTIDALARTGVVYRNAFSVSGWTLPSIASIMTGRYPREHGMVSWESAIDTTLTTMAQMLKSRGYNTGGFVSHIVLKRAFGLATGFDTYDDSVLNVGHPHKVSTAYPLTNLALEYIESVEEPYFVWIHYFDPHFDYLIHERYEAFGESATDRYDQEIAATDRQIDRLVRAIHARGDIDDTVIIFTSDHGEEFGERGGVYHRTLYDEVLRVPFVIRAPGLAPAVDDRPVEQIDVLPTVYGLLGIKDDRLPGRDMLSPAAGDDRAVYAERQHPPLWAQQSVRNSRFKLIVVEDVDTTLIAEAMIPNLPQIREDVQNVIPGTYLFDLVNDPGETYNIYSDDHEEGRNLLVNLVEYLESGAPVQSPRVEMDEETLEKLRSLGYIQ